MTHSNLLNQPASHEKTSAQTIAVPHQIYYEDERILVLQTLAMAIDDQDNIDNQDNVDSAQVLQTTRDQTTQSQQNMEHANSFGSFNLGLHVNDDAKKVLQHRCQLLKQLNQYLMRSTRNPVLSVANSALSHVLSPVEQIHWLNQVHGNQVVDIDAIVDAMVDVMNSRLNSDQLTQRVDAKPVDNSQYTQRTQSTQKCDQKQLAQHGFSAFYPMSADAMTSCQTGKALAIMTADCVPIMLYQPSTGRIAAVHAGWQGLASGVIANTLKQFEANQLDVVNSADRDGDGDGDAQEQLPLATDSSIMAWIGACISVNNYEVGTEVLNKLLSGSLKYFNFQQNAVELAAAISQPHQQSGKVWLNLPKMARMQLASLGVLVQNTQIPCSYEGLHYYSYRRKTHLQQANTGRMAMMIVRHSD